MIACVDRFICCTLVRCGVSYVKVVEALSVDARPFLRKETCLLEGQVPYNAWLIWWGRLQKECQDGCLFPVTLPVTGGLGENATGALNALVPVPASGSRRRPCARRLPIRSSLFPCLMVSGARVPIDSQDALSVFETMAVEDRTCDWIERRVGGLDLRTGILVMHIRYGTPY